MKLKPLIAIGSAVILAAISSGCGPSYSKTEVKVTLDGQPVSNATVTLIPQDQDAIGAATGLTESNGSCYLETGGKKGVPKGKYKAIVVKTPEVKGGGQEGDIMEKMKGQYSNMPKQGAGGAPGAPPDTKPKSDLPAKYAEGNTTPFTNIEIPAPGGVIELKLESDKGGAGK